MPLLLTQCWLLFYPCQSPSVNQPVNIKCNVNGAVAATSSCLVCLGWPALCIEGMTIFYSCSLPVCLLLVSVYLWITPCLHVALQMLLRLLAEQASLLDGHCGANEETAYFYTQQDLWERCFGFRPCVCFFFFPFFSKNIIVFLQIGIMSCMMKIEMCIMAKYMLCPSAVYRLGRQFGSSLRVAIF